MRVVLSFVAFGILLGGCASSTESLQRETARNIGGNTLPEAVTVSNVNRGAMSVTWDAQTPNGSIQLQCGRYGPSHALCEEVASCLFL